jgi:hypothetical protein
MARFPRYGTILPMDILGAESRRDRLGATLSGLPAGVQGFKSCTAHRNTAHQEERKGKSGEAARRDFLKLVGADLGWEALSLGMIGLGILLAAMF